MFFVPFPYLNNEEVTSYCSGYIVQMTLEYENITAFTKTSKAAGKSCSINALLLWPISWQRNALASHI
jgi:hypothetical protein